MLFINALKICVAFTETHCTLVEEKGASLIAGKLLMLKGNFSSKCLFSRQQQQPHASSKAARLCDVHLLTSRSALTSCCSLQTNIVYKTSLQAVNPPCTLCILRYFVFLYSSSCCFSNPNFSSSLTFSRSYCKCTLEIVYQ